MSRNGFIALVLVLLAIGAGAYWYLKRGSVSEVLVPPVTVDAAAIEPDAGPGKSLAEGDELLRKLGAAGSKSQELASWLAVPDIVQRLAAAARLVADGKSPAPVMAFIEITDEFSVVESKKSIFIAPASYARYDVMIQVFTSVDPDYAGKSYGELRPYFDAAFAQVARPGERFDDVLVLALKRVVGVNVPDGNIELVERGAIYLFKDPALESLTAAEKHMLRIGPKNAKALQDSFRRFAASAGLPLTP